MKTLLISAWLCFGSTLALDAATKPFPAHWGEPPKLQTRDLRELPGGYGTGSSTLYNWIVQNMDKDRQTQRAPKLAPAQPQPSLPPAAPSPTDKPPSGKSPDKSPAEKEPAKRAEKPPPESADHKLTTGERQAIQDYVKKHQEKEQTPRKGKGKGKGKDAKSLPPGLAKKVEHGGNLPPGWQSKLTVGETMPEAVLQQAQPVPKDLPLPPSPKGTTNLVLEGKVLRVLEKSRQILDVFDLNK